MSLTHTVLFNFNDDASPEDVKATCERFVGLKQNCVHSETQTPYILSLKGGRDNSTEGRQDGLTHGFVIEFASQKDRDYYVKEDPAHSEFLKSVRGLVKRIVVVDFTNGVF